MTALAEHLIARIHESGPISLAEYMSDCLLHPKHGYYSTQTPFGQAGDFITAPEISQMFGELIGLSLAQSWLDQGAPAPFALVELGPGRGTLMADILRATKAVPGFHNALELHLVEASDALKRAQASAIGREITFHADVTTLPDLPTWLVANEFFDALPIRQFERSENGWRERLIGVQDGALGFGLGPETNHPALAHRMDDTEIGHIVELCPHAPVVMAQIGARIEQFGGAALIIDYGDWRSLGDTVQALADHKPVGIFTRPGEVDLSAHVDFEILISAVPCGYSRITPQGVFLERLGITERAQTLAQHMDSTALDIHIAAHRRLTHPTEMGNLFKVLALFPNGKTPPAGCET